MTEAELLEELAHESATAEGMTYQELRDATGLGERAVRRTLREAVAAGRLRVGRKQVRDISGKAQLVPTYIRVE